MGNILCPVGEKGLNSKKKNHRSLAEEGENESAIRKIGMDDFSFIKVIGRGAFGKVVLVEKKIDKKLYAMKIMKKNEIRKRN